MAHGIGTWFAMNRNSGRIMFGLLSFLCEAWSVPFGIFAGRPTAIRRGVPFASTSVGPPLALGRRLFVDELSHPTLLVGLVQGRELGRDSDGDVSRAVDCEH